MAEPQNERDRVGAGVTRDQLAAPGAVNEEPRTGTSGAAVELKNRASELTGKVKAKASEQAEELKATAMEKKDELKDRAAAKVDEEKYNLGIRVQALARALHQAGESLERDGENGLARWGHQAAEQVERFSGYLDRRDFNGFVGDLENSARDNPGTFVGGSFAAGLLVARFLRASRPDAETAQPSNESVAEGAAARQPGRSWQSGSIAPQSMAAAPRRPARSEESLPTDDRSGHGGTHG
jgi:hypothetical protein